MKLTHSRTLKSIAVAPRHSHSHRGTKRSLSLWSAMLPQKLG
ncbi:hypothetical protein CKA32_002086 [Geitlerinema sp. FC II]|nr:hypothetical protein CKA32_002086 [Geitlerinema sp. FC II]